MCLTGLSDDNVEGLRKTQSKCSCCVIVVEVLNFEMALYRDWIAGLLKGWGRDSRS
jgi:hypothetical protein